MQFRMFQRVEKPRLFLSVLMSCQRRWRLINKIIQIKYRSKKRENYFSKKLNKMMCQNKITVKPSNLALNSGKKMMFKGYKRATLFICALN